MTIWGAKRGFAAARPHTEEVQSLELQVASNVGCSAVGLQPAVVLVIC
jgi:hypothetical protein